MPFRSRTIALAVATAASALALTASSASALQISELRLHGQAGAKDEFVEIYNETDAPHTVAGEGGGYAVRAADGITRFVIPNGVVIPPGGHYLAVGTDYSNSGYAAGDKTFNIEIPSDKGVALFKTAVAGQFSLANRLDAFGFAANAPLYREGEGFPTAHPFPVNMAFVRDLTPGAPKDTGDNAADFRVPDTNGTSLVQAEGYQLLGAPGPQNTLSMLSGTGGVSIGRVDPNAPATAAPNVVRDLTADSADNASFGTLLIRRTIKNETGQPLTRLRLRVADITAFPSPTGTADLRPRTVGDSIATIQSALVTVKGTTLDADASQPNGGGINSSLRVPSVTPASPLAPGATIRVQFLFGVQQPGTYRVCLHSESLPVGTGGALRIGGDTQDQTKTAETGCGLPSLKVTPKPPQPPVVEEPADDVTPAGEPSTTPQTQPQPEPQPRTEPQPQPLPQGDTRAPRFLSGIALTRGTFTAGRWGTKVTFKLDEPAKVAFRVKRGKRVLPGAIALNAKAGTNRFRFTGKLRGRKLAAGRYSLVATAVDAAGNRSTASAKRFRVVVVG